MSLTLTGEPAHVFDRLQDAMSQVDCYIAACWTSSLTNLLPRLGLTSPEGLYYHGSYALGMTSV